MRIDINIFSCMILIVLFIGLMRQRPSVNVRHRLFVLLLVFNFLILLLDTGRWIIDGNAGSWLHTIDNLLTCAYYILNPLPTALWVLFVDYHLFHSEQRTRKTTAFLGFLLVLNLIGSVVSYFTPFFYYIDGQNAYQWGPHFVGFLLFCYLPLVYAYLLLLINRRRVSSGEFTTMMLFALPPIVGGIIQSVYNGLPLLWNGLTLSMLLLFVNIQYGLAHTDYLTGVFNRKQADDYVRQKIRASLQGHSFSAVMIDIDDFKTINDRFGHAEGDVCLESVVKILRASLRRDDFLARMGGDEFLLVLDIVNKEELNKAIDRIHKQIRDYNTSSGKPYRISLSLGYDLYNLEYGMSRGLYLKHLDQLMYADKMAKKLKKDQLMNTQIQM